MPLSELEKMYKPYVKKMIKNFDQKQQALESGIGRSPPPRSSRTSPTSASTRSSRTARSGRCRAAAPALACAAFWSKPHVIALDEPTNYLDNDRRRPQQGAKDFKGAVVTVSENEAFTAEISNEKWAVENGSLNVTQLRDAKAREEDPQPRPAPPPPSTLHCARVVKEGAGGREKSRRPAECCLCAESV